METRSKARETFAPAMLLVLSMLASPARGQDDRMTPIATPAQPTAIALDTGALPSAPVAESWHAQYGSRFARNVTRATLTPFLPDPAIATGAAMIVAPGGGFRTLSMENEGWNVAKALAARDVAAFVLKYRLKHGGDVHQRRAPVASHARTAGRGHRAADRGRTRGVRAGPFARKGVAR
jgi:hypothetical protein